MRMEVVIEISNGDGALSSRRYGNMIKGFGDLAMVSWATAGACIHRG